MDLLCTGLQRPAGYCGLCAGEALRQTDLLEFPLYGPIVHGPTTSRGILWSLRWGGSSSDRSIVCICLPICTLPVYVETLSEV